MRESARPHGAVRQADPPERRARARGAEVRGGLDMFVAQGAAQFRLFTGRRPPLAVMRRAVAAALGRQEMNREGDHDRE